MTSATAPLSGPRLFALVALTMTAFAANSLLNRAALAEAGIGPAAFAAIRLAAGALMLVVLARRRGPLGLTSPGRWIGVLSLTAYMLGFSFAYLSLDAGLGALILFGGVQITMFAGALLARDTVPLARWLGAGMALAGLALLLWPGAVGRPDPLGLGLMMIAAVGWGIYSLHGRGSRAPLADTAANFLLALPLGLLAWLVWASSDPLTLPGVVLAVVSGALTSGLGYALWYAVLPSLGATRAAVAQLTVPVIAALGGLILLGEAVTWLTGLATLLVLGGVAISLRKG
ncbi:DMT family transporter [Dinoroseobacter sp. S375]|uniref:DMT family transporter n=1 Tax=Dinoroseobacter sp. S375 TaxID=3415136 RepID=UPI003C7EBE56